MKFFKESKGVISVFLVIILVPMLTMSAFFVDSSKMKLAKGVAESAGDLALNTALTNYDTTLKDMYGLFATAQDMDDLFAKLEDYYRSSITSAGVSPEDADSYVDQIMGQLGMIAEGDETADIMNMELVDFSATKRTDATLANATVMQKQIVEFMKYRAPINTGLSFLASLKSFSTLSKQTELVDKRQKYYEAQADVMEEARKAWDAINEYNKSGFITPDGKANDYFGKMQSNFDGYEDTFNKLAKRVIMDLYETQDYASFKERPYQVVYETMKVGDQQYKEVPVLYLDWEKNNSKTPYPKLTRFSEDNKASADDVANALINFKRCLDAYEKSSKALPSFDDGTYGLQFLVQMNRGGYYESWTYNMSMLYDAYSEMRHAATYSDDSSGSVMETKGDLFGTGEVKAYSDYYSTFSSKFKSCADDFNGKSIRYTRYLSQCAAGADTNPADVAQEINRLYELNKGYIDTLKRAKENLETAVKHLHNVQQAVAPDGTLNNCKDKWQQVAGDDAIKDSSMSKQDLAEIDSLSTYLNEGEVKKLIERLENIIPKLEETIEQVDSYTYFGKKLYEIDSYDTFLSMLSNSIGRNNLLSVSTNKAKLENQVSGWCAGKFVAENKLDTSWVNDSGTQPQLAGDGTDKLNFYSYLYTHFNKGTVSNNTEKKEENDSNGKELYKNYKDIASQKSKEAAEGVDEGSISSGNEISGLDGRPSVESAGSSANGTDQIVPGSDDLEKVSGGIGSMFAGITQAAMDMSVDLRDKLYVADYVLGMFSYDTIEKEFQKKNPDKQAAIQSITLTPIDAEHNYAYGKEVEYVVYGGNNSGNIKKAYATIYGIRLGFNLIYAFSDASIRDTAFAIATPISAATLGVIPVPLIQAAVVIGIACCESGLDLADLRDGESVPLFKNNQSWKTSVKGMMKAVKSEIGDALIEVGESAIDTGLGALNGMLDMTDEELTDFVKENEDKVLDSVVASYDTLITRHANTAIQKLTTLCNNAIEEHMLHPSTDMVQMVTDGLDKWLAEEASRVDPSTDLSYIVKAEAVKLIKEGYIQPVLNELQKNAEQAQGAVAEAANAITEILDKIRTAIARTISRTSAPVIEYKDKMISEVKSSLASGADSLKKTLEKQINGVFGGASGSAAKPDTDSTGMSSLLSFRYSDYMRLFLMVGLYTNEEGVLLRTADVIQSNMSKVEGDTQYRLSNSAVYVEISATIQAKPTLLALPLFADVEKNPVSNQNWYTFDYKSIKGY